MINHDDVLDLLTGQSVIALRWLVLKDRIVECDVQLRCLDYGSIDPLVDAIRKQLLDQGPMSVEDLTISMGGQGAIGIRVVSEVLAVLRRANEVSQEVSIEGKVVFGFPKVTKWSARRGSEKTVEKRFSFLPRAGRLEPKIRTTRKNEIEELERNKHLSWCVLPDEEVLYSKRLSEVIRDNCTEYYRARKWKVDDYYEDNESRLEVLQRSWLMSVDLRFIEAIVARYEMTERWVLNRCYLYDANISGERQLIVRVYGYPKGPIESTYTQYLTKLVNKSREFRDAVQRASQPLF
jgi:hypothetical protein